MVHRAILGSIERFMAILIEHLGGKWPFFLSPRQVVIIPLSNKFNRYCKSVYLYLHRLGYQVDLDDSNHTMPKKIVLNQKNQYNFLLIAGEEEERTGTVDIRTRDNERIGKMRCDDLHLYFQTLKPDLGSKYEEFYAEAWDPKKYEKCCAGGKSGSCKVVVGN